MYRDHKKLIIIDGEKAFTGGLNIANEYFDQDFENVAEKFKNHHLGAYLWA